MAAYHTQQINVGSVQAPEVGSIFTDLADRLSKNYQQGLQNTKTGAELARQQVLNQRADVEWDKQQAVQQASKDIARELTNTPYAQKFGGAENTALIDAEILKETERRDKLGLAPFNAEEAAGIQKTYEANRPFKEDARGKIAAMLMSRGASAAQANQEAEGLTAGMISRADQQTIANQTRDDQQKYYDKVADSKMELYKTLTSNDLERMKTLGNSYGINGGGGSGGKGGISLSTNWDEVMTKDYNLSPYGTGWFGDNAKVRDLAVAARKDNVSPWAFQKAIENSLIRSASGDTIDEAALKNNLGTYKNVEQKLRSAQSGDSAKTAGISVDSLLDRTYVPQTVVGYDPKKMVDLLKANAPTVAGNREQVLGGGTGGENKASTENKSGSTLADRNNNWGNIKYNKGTDWLGGSEGDKGFVKFDTPELGARALAKTIMNGGVGKTVDQYINKYAPASDNNDTKSYIADVAKKLGKKSDEIITLDDVPTLMEAIAKREGGNYSKDVLSAGYKMAVSPQLAEFHKAVKAKDGSADKLLADMSAKFNDKSIDWSNGASNVDSNEIKKSTFDDVVPQESILSKYGKMNLTQAGKEGYKDVGKFFETPTVLREQQALDASKGKMSEDEYKTYLQWADKEDPGISPLSSGFRPNTAEDNAKVFARQKDIAFKYNNAPQELSAYEKRWIESSKQTPNGRILLRTLGII